MSADVDDTDIEARVRASLGEIAQQVALDGEFTSDFGEPHPVRDRGPMRTLATAGIAAVCVVALAVGVGVVVHRSDRSTRVGNPPTSGSAPASSTTTTTDPAAAGALEAWSHFPVDAQPRPIVLIGEDTDGPALGFTNPDIAIADAEKEALDAGSISIPASFPAGPPTADGLPIIGAADAFARLRTEGTGTATMVLQTTDVQLGTGSFLTDRGWRTLPAWKFSFHDVENPVAVLAIAPSATFPGPSGPDSSQLGAKTTDGSRAVVVTFPGSLAECGDTYSARVTESNTAVAVRVDTTFSGRTCVQVGVSRSITVTLREPLGTRVLVDDKTNGAVAVTPR